MLSDSRTCLEYVRLSFLVDLSSIQPPIQARFLTLRQMQFP
ncbi:hypothetical protein GGP65_002901 [Salinibacter ruber]|nr:hypothetical protein [Salinibacter ruber]